MRRVVRSTMVACTLLAVSALGDTATPAMASGLDQAGYCGQLFSTQARSAATAMPKFVRYYWVATKTTKTEITINLVVYGKSSALTYSGFACDIGANGTMTMHVNK